MMLKMFLILSLESVGGGDDRDLEDADRNQFHFMQFSRDGNIRLIFSVTPHSLNHKGTARVLRST